MAENGNRNLTIRLDQDTLRKARLLAAERATSISRLVSQQIATSVAEDEVYQRAQRIAFDLLEPRPGRGRRQRAVAS